MRPITIILIVVSLLTGFGAVFLGKRYIERTARDAAARQEELKRDVDVLVAAKDMQQGHKLQDSDLRWTPWPIATAEAAKVLVRKEGKAPLDMLAGTALRRNVVAGEPITEQAVFKPGKGSLMPGLIAPGKKAVGIKVTANSTASGFVLPGDMVDVVMTAKLKGAGNGPQVVSETILTGIRVLAVNQEISSSGESSSASTTKKTKKKESKDKAAEAQDTGEVAMVGKTVAIEVTPEQAERVLAAQEAGQLNLVLRSMAEGSEHQARGVPYVTDLDVSTALKSAGSGPRIIRGGQASTQ